MKKAVDLLTMVTVVTNMCSSSFAGDYQIAKQNGTGPEIKTYETVHAECESDKTAPSNSFTYATDQDEDPTSPQAPPNQTNPQPMRTKTSKASFIWVPEGEDDLTPPDYQKSQSYTVTGLLSVDRHQAPNGYARAKGATVPVHYYVLEAVTSNPANDPAPLTVSSSGTSTALSSSPGQTGVFEVPIDISVQVSTIASAYAGGHMSASSSLTVTTTKIELKTN